MAWIDSTISRWKNSKNCVSKQGNQIDTLAERHGVVERTIIYWLDRFEEEPIEQVPYDAPRPGRPLKLDDDEREQLFEDLQNPPTERGYEQQAWSPKLLLAHVKDEYDVEYKEMVQKNDRS
jgi:transposase